MAKIREIKGRMKAVGNIKRITKTMQMIATARFQAALRRAEAAKPYAQKIRELVGRLQGAGDSGSGGGHPLFQSPDEPVGRRLLLVLTSSRGMCGGYNANILRLASKYMAQHKDSSIDIDVVGKKGLAFFRFSEIPISNALTQFTDVPDLEEVYRIADRYINDFTNRKYDEIAVAYMSFHSAARQSAEILSLLPLKQDESEQPQVDLQGTVSHQSEYDYSPAPEQLVGELLPITVKTQLMQCFNEASVGEQIARMVAMKSATESANKMGKSLTRSFNRARQAAITTELSEIIAGSAALN